MAGRKETKNKLKRLNGRVKIRVRKRALNLPDQLWQAYQSSQQPIEKCEDLVHSEQKNVTDEENKNIIIEEKKHTVEEKKDIVEEKKDIVEEKKDIVEDKKDIIVEEKKNIIVEEKKPTILKQLSVKLDNYLVFPHNWNSLIQKLNESIEIHKSMYQNLINAKQILISCSVRSCIQKTEESKSLTYQVITADAELEEVIKNMHKQEDALLNCKKVSDAVSVPLHIMNTSFFENANQERLHTPIEYKEIELQNEKERYNSLQAELQTFQNKFIRMKHIFQNKMQEKNALISQLKLKLFRMRKHYIKICKTHRLEKEVNVNPMENQIHQLKTLMGLAYSMMENITEQQKVTSNSTADKKDYIIKDLKQQLEKLKVQNKTKDKEIKKLLESAEQLKKEKVEAEGKHTKIDKEKDLKINQLTSTLNELKRKHDRWMTDRYYQKCHSIMLFEKMRQLEKNQTTLLSVKKFECKKVEVTKNV